MNLRSLFHFLARNNKAHWDKIYNKYSPDELGWHQEYPDTSLRFIGEAGLGRDARIIDIGGGTSRLTEVLLDKNYNYLSVFDISSNALRASRERLGKRGKRITWIEGDITTYVFNQEYDVWHDRAVFHFLTEKTDRNNYLKTLDSTLSTRGHVIISTFSPEAPPKCSGLPIMRYTPELLQNEIGSRFNLINSTEEMHNTPGNTQQKFIYCHFIRSVK